MSSTTQETMASTFGQARWGRSSSSQLSAGSAISNRSEARPAGGRPAASRGTAGSASTTPSGRHVGAAGSPSHPPVTWAEGGTPEWMPAAQSSGGAGGGAPGVAVPVEAAGQVGGGAAGGGVAGSSSHADVDGSQSLVVVPGCCSSAGQTNERSLGSQVWVVSSNGQAGAGSNAPGSS